jgi:predicted CoA-binding protein
VGNPFNDPAVIERILETARTIAVVGLSPDPSRPSHRVADYLQRAGYQVIPVNPKVDQVLGQKSSASLRHVGRPVDVVDIFRRSQFVAAVVDDALATGARAIWMQQGVVDQVSAERARAAGLDVVMDSCMMAEHSLRHRGFEKQEPRER